MTKSPSRSPNRQPRRFDLFFPMKSINRRKMRFGDLAIWGRSKSVAPSRVGAIYTDRPHSSDANRGQLASQGNDAVSTCPMHFFCPKKPPTLLWDDTRRTTKACQAKQGPESRRLFGMEFNRVKSTTFLRLTGPESTVAGCQAEPVTESRRLSEIEMS